ncbi:MAG TPA: thiamine ABC transporter substrate-binding protein [Anaerolineae bacterium]|nr:thiamine ABC transporter substrate-binding protein [Anaerolineae bacterium]
MTTRPLTVLPIVLLIFALLAACAAPPAPDVTSPAAQPPRKLVLMTHDSFAVSEAVIRQFEAEHNATVEFLKAGDAGEALNKACLSKANPLADLFFGVDNTFLSRAIDCDIFESYASQVLAAIPDELQLDPQNRLLPVDFGYINLNYDRAWFEQRGLTVPQTLRDLTRPEYKGLLVAPNPATSSPGLAFLLATVAAFGEQGDYTYLDFWRELRANDVLVTDGWSDAYFSHFTVGSGGMGDRPLVVSYSTSPAADVFYSEGAKTQPDSANISPAGETFRQIEFVGILKGTQQQALAREFVDYLLGVTFQEDIPLQMFVYPTNHEAAIPDLFTQFAPLPADPAVLDPAAIEANRERWIEAWAEAVLR